MSDSKGLKNLMNKSLSIAIAAFSSIQSLNAKSIEIPEIKDHDYTNSLNKKALKPKLVLKLNLSNPDEGHLLLLHTSHSSHRSHSSHSSHSSHYSSSYSSGSSSSSQTTPSTIYTPSSPSNSSYNGSTSSRSSSSPIPTVNTKKKPATSTTKTNGFYNSDYETTPTIVMSLGDRELYKGCQGSDVEELQKLLSELGYDIIISEYFGDRTEKAVIQFQKNNELKPDGRVGGKTILMIKSKL